MDDGRIRGRTAGRVSAASSGDRRPGSVITEHFTTAEILCELFPDGKSPGGAPRPSVANLGAKETATEGDYPDRNSPKRVSPARRSSSPRA